MPNAYVPARHKQILNDCMDDARTFLEASRKLRSDAFCDVLSDADKKLVHQTVHAVEKALIDLRRQLAEVESDEKIVTTPSHPPALDVSDDHFSWLLRLGNRRPSFAA